MLLAALFAVLGGISTAEAAGTLSINIVEEDLSLPLPGATVRLTGPSGSTLELVSDANGLLELELEAGTWTVVVVAPGFQGVTIAGIVVVDDRLVRQQVLLRMSSAQESVVISDGSSSRSSVITRHFLSKAPAGRSYQTAVQSTDGASNQRRSSAAASQPAVSTPPVSAAPAPTPVAARAPASGSNPNLAGGATNQNQYVYPGESYDHAGHAPLIMADQDRWSTFAIDVDTASYALARAKLTGGVMPDPAAVRVEEFVNAFRYAYPDDESEQIAIHMEAAPHPLRDDRVLLNVALDTTHAVTHDRPVRLTFLVDVSGSMTASDKLPLVRSSLHRLVDGLGAEDRVSIVTYAGRTVVELEPSWTVDRGPIHGAIDRLHPGGSTAMGSGIELAYSMASDMYVPGAENRVVILTDGDANVGKTSADALLKDVNAHAGKGISLSVVGFGQGNYKDALLERLANQGDGNYQYVDGEREAERVFGRDLAANMVTLARDVKVQLEFPEESVLAWRQIGYENRVLADEEFLDDAVDAGELGTGHQVTALYELVLRDNPKGDLVRAHLRAKPPGKDQAATQIDEALPVAALRTETAAASDPMRWATAVATFAEVLRRSPHVAETTFADVLSLVDAARDPANPDHTELRELVVKAAELSGGPNVALVPKPVPTRERDASPFSKADAVVNGLK